LPNSIAKANSIVNLGIEVELRINNKDNLTLYKFIIAIVILRVGVGVLMLCKALLLLGVASKVPISTIVVSIHGLLAM
jgi:hypothetical protein